jgi:hypothetical protein
MHQSWLWGSIGLVLLALEMATGTFYILWFGIAGILLAGLVWLMPEISLAVQLACYAMTSLGSLYVWRRWYKRTSSSTSIGQSQGEEIGRAGTVIAAISPDQRGRIQFTQGLMGSREWAAVADCEIAVGDKAEVIAIEGNSLRVKPAMQNQH